MIFLPLIPSFIGDIKDKKNAAYRTYMHNTWSSISKGSDSLIELLKKDGVLDPGKYLKFYCLRQHDVLNEVPV